MTTSDHTEPTRNLRQAYNGWTNYETWCVNLWLSNDQGLEEMTRELVADLMGEEATEDDSADQARENRYQLAERLKDMVDELAEQTCPGCREGASFVSDLLGAALSEVDWYELAEAWISQWLETI